MESIKLQLDTICIYTISSFSIINVAIILRKYRPNVFDNNTKVTFIFFQYILNDIYYNIGSKLQFKIYLCSTNLYFAFGFKAFFDARLGLFAHVITVLLLLGFIVPNSYEYMFLQIIAGIVTILTVSELYKSANLFISVGQITLIYIIAYFAFFVIHEGTVETIKWETFTWFVLCGT